MYLIGLWKIQNQIHLKSSQETSHVNSEHRHFRDPLSLCLQEIMWCATSIGHLCTCSKSFSDCYHPLKERGCGHFCSQLSLGWVSAKQHRKWVCITSQCRNVIIVFICYFLSQMLPAYKRWQLCWHVSRRTTSIKHYVPKRSVTFRAVTKTLR